MARAGMTRWHTRNTASGAEGGDEVQRSLELLDRVLSEFDDLENGNIAVEEASGHVSSTPEDESPSLGGHQSEDDGYMSMNGRRTKFVLNFRPVPDEGHLLQLPPTPEPAEGSPPNEIADFPPPPEEAERIISTLLPRVSPINSKKRSNSSPSRNILKELTFSGDDRTVTTATQTTLPKTRHQRPYGWENGTTSEFHLQDPLTDSSVRFRSLPYSGSLQWCSPRSPLPPRTVPTVVERHREVRRRTGSTETETDDLPLRTLSELTDDDHANFSDDSLEELLPPPPPVSKRSSIAWEVPFDLDDEALLTPGSTKVIGRRRRKSTDRSSTGSIPRIRDQDDWPDPPTGTEDGSLSSFSDSSHWDSSVNKLDDSIILPPELSSSDISASGTYIIRKGRRRERASLHNIEHNQTNKRQHHSTPSPKQADLKRCSSTFDNIKTLLKEGLIEGLDDAPPDFQPPTPPVIVRVVSLPTLTIDETCQTEIQTSDVQIDVKLHDVGIQVMEDLAESTHKESVEESTQVSLEFREFEKDEIPDPSPVKEEPIPVKDEPTPVKEEPVPVKEEPIQIVASEHIMEDPWVMANEISEVKVVPVVEDTSEKPPSEFKVMVEVLQHEFGPLPPSPVQEDDDDEYPDTLQNSPRNKTDSVPEPFYRCLEPPGSDPIGARLLNRPCPEPPPHREQTSSLKTRSMDAGFSRNHKNQHSGSRREIPSERRTLPSELPGPSRRRTFQKRSSHSPREEGHMQVSCSLPETPIFARGCDIPRTPHRRAPDIPGSTRTAPRPVGIQTGSYRKTIGAGHGMGTSVSLGQAMVGAELLRLAGPGRGWYPRHRQPRPASVEHLDHLAHPSVNPGPWDSSRKPLTLPPNLTPKFFHRSPREALRRVTSLLIRKGNTKENKKEPISPTTNEGENTCRKRGFFKNFWKRSRHYSLEQQ
uniref:Uncharacterized protein n=1 Tax=Clastoptera arizonana TaxID=38151 RepID=A0A1B6CIF9_9HEMI